MLIKRVIQTARVEDRIGKNDKTLKPHLLTFNYLIKILLDYVTIHMLLLRCEINNKKR